MSSHPRSIGSRFVVLNRGMMEGGMEIPSHVTMNISIPSDNIQQLPYGLSLTYASILGWPK